MARRRTGATPPLIALLACLALGYVVWLELRAPAPGVAIQESAPAAIAALPFRPTVETPGIRSFSETLKRPLFHETRRPPQPDTPSAAPSPTAPPLALVGVIITPDRRVALIREPRSAAVTELAVGQSIGGWSLERILPDRIVMRSGAAQETYRLEAEPAPAPTRRGVPPQRRVAPPPGR